MGSPALTLSALINVEINKELLVLVLFAPVVTFITFIVTYFTRRFFLQSLSIKTFGAFAVGVLIMNTGFALPFIEQVYGLKGVAKYVMINLGNSFVAFVFVYSLAATLGNGSANKIDYKFIAQKLVLAPPIWGLVIGMIINISNIELAEYLTDTFELLGRFVSPLILLALGLKFSLKFSHYKLISLGIVLRMVLGLIISLLFIFAFSVEGISAYVLLLCGIAPIGFNSITFSELEGLDSKFAAQLVSVGLAAALIIYPIVLTLIQT